MLLHYIGTTSVTPNNIRHTEQHPSHRTTSVTPNTQSVSLHSRPPTDNSMGTLYHMLQITILRSWGWVKSCPKHVELFISVFNQLDAQNLFHNKFYFMPLYMFRAHVLIIRRSKLHYTASGIITPIGVMIQILYIKLVKYWDKYIEMHGQQNVKKCWADLKINKLLSLYLVCSLLHLYRWCTAKHTSNLKISLWIKINITYQSCRIGVKCNSEKDDLRDVKNAVIAVGGECSIHRKYREKKEC